MKRFKYSLLLFFFLNSIIVGCKKEWLDAKTMQSLTVPATLQDFQAMLDNTDIMNLNGQALQEVASDGHSLTDGVLTTLSDFSVSAYTWSNIFTYKGVPGWLSSYQAVLYANLVLEGLGKVQPTNSIDQQTWNNLKGGALFFRALYFYELAQLWAPAYDSLSVNTDLSIPLRLSSDANIPQTRSTVQQTYDQIINDLLTAKDLLSVTSVYKTRPCKPAAFALLARVYLAKRDYTNAGIYADSCLQLSHALLDYNSFSTSATLPFPIFNSEVIFHETMSAIPNVKSPYCMIDTLLYASYTGNDLRKQLFFGVNTTGSANYDLNSFYFKGMYNNDVGPFSGLAVDEMYLIRAECFARAGYTNAAMTDLNTLLKTRWKPNTFVNYTATDANDALKQILTERKKELLLRGLRWTDLRRLNKEPRFAVTLTRTFKGVTYTLSPNSYQYTFPIPQDILQMSGFAQNPGW